MPKKLEVIASIDSNEVNDAEFVPQVSWSEENKFACYYIGAWNDGLDFLPKTCDARTDQEEDPARHFFVFNRVPKNMSEIHKAIEAWLA